MKDLFFKDETAEVKHLFDQYKAANLRLCVKKDICARRLHKALCAELDLSNVESTVFLGKFIVQHIDSIMQMELIKLDHTRLPLGSFSQESICSSKVMDVLTRLNYLKLKGDGVYKPMAVFGIRLNELSAQIQAEYVPEQPAQQPL